MEVPLLDLDAQYRPLRDDLLAAIVRVCDAQAFILGPEVEGLEREMASFLEVDHAVGVSSGTDALIAALMAAGVGRGDEVVTSTYSFFATAGSIARLGARPVLVDIDPRTYNLDPAAAAAVIGPRTRAILPVHLFGQSADLAPIVEAASAGGVAIIEDAAQAVGARYQDRFVGTIGEGGCFSFFPSKNLGAFGDGGLVVSRDVALADRVRLLRGHGAQPKYYHRIIGGNFRLDAVQAAVLRVKLPWLASWTAARRANASRYSALFAAAGLADRIGLPHETPSCFHVYNQFVVRTPHRDELRAHLAAFGVATEIYYPVPFHMQECFSYLEHRPGEFPHAEAAARETMALPIYPGLTEAQQAHVVEGMRTFFECGRRSVEPAAASGASG